MSGRLRLKSFFYDFFKQLTKVKVLPTKKKQNTLLLPNITAHSMISVSPMFRGDLCFLLSDVMVEQFVCSLFWCIVLLYLR